MWSEIANGCDLLALVAAVGALVQAGWLYAPRGTPAGGGMQRRADRYFLLALIFLSLTTAATLLVRSADISGLRLSQLGPVVPQVLERTHFGSFWIGRMAVLVVLWAAWFAPRGFRRRTGFLALAALCLFAEAWGWAVTGHPGDHGDFAPLAWVATLHIFSAGLWGGAVLAVTLVALPVLDRLEALGSEAVTRFALRLSAVSAVGLGLLLGSGIYNAWSQLVYISDFWTSAYGNVLGVKLLLFFAMAGIGAGNRFWYVPTVVRACRIAGVLPRRRALRRLLQAVALEAVLLLAIVGLVAVLVHTMPPAAMAGIMH